MNPSDGRSGVQLHRRTFLRGTALAVAGGAAVAGTASPAAAADGVDLSTWFSDVSNFDGITDARGETDVRVAVGARGNGGGFAFDPPALRVDPGTTVVWEWTGEGGMHDVTAEDGAYGSDLVADAGHAFEHTFESGGASLYVCSPHRAMGMKGAVVVGDVAVATTPEPTPTPVEHVEREPRYGDWFDGVAEFGGTVDARGQSEVRIAVEEGAFSPAAVHVDPGTNVIWEWADGDREHCVVAEDGSYESPQQTAGQYGLQFDGVGVSKYACALHGGSGMRGAVVVGDVFAGTGVVTVQELSVLGMFGVAITSPLAFGVVLWLKRHRERRGHHENATDGEPLVGADRGRTG
jgi:halocyanin-like protein